MEAMKEQREGTVLRIWLCGPLTLEWIDPTNEQVIPALDPTAGGRDRAAALSLLCLLLCQPNRRAYRDWIMEQFWPEGTRDITTHRLENIFSYLRKLLRPPTGGESLLTSIRSSRNKGVIYCLADFPDLWVDADALTWQVEQAARMERFGDDALPFWERAYTLLKRGPFLSDEPYAAWVNEHRDRITGYMRQCVHALAYLFLHQNERTGKAEALLLLRTYWQHEKTDEDALRPLLEILGEQERYQEAEEYYQQLLTALAEMDPDGEGKMQEPDPRTQDIRGYLRTKQIRRTPKATLAPVFQDRRLNEAHRFHSPSLAHVVQLPQKREQLWRETVSAEQNKLVGAANRIGGPLAQSVGTFSFETAFLDVSTWFGARVNDLKAFGTSQQHASALSCQQQQSFVHAEIETWGEMTDNEHQLTNGYLISRRTALATLATLSSSLLTKMRFGPVTTIIIEEFLAESTTSTVACWHLLRGDGLTTIEHTLPKYLPLLIALMKQYPPYRIRASYLASQGFLLFSLVALHQLHFPERVAYCKQAVELAKESGDETLLVASLMHLGDAFFTNGQRAEMLYTYSQAEYQSRSAETSMFIRSKVLAELAHAYAQNGQEQEALRSIGEARSIFTEQSCGIPVFLSTDYGLFQLILFEGLNALDLGNCEEIQKNSRRAHDYYQGASNKLGQIDQLSQTVIVPVRIRVEIANQRALAAVKAGKLEEFEKYLLEGAKGAKTLSSEKRRQEAIANWKTAREQWPLDKKVMELADALF